MYKLSEMDSRDKAKLLFELLPEEAVPFIYHCKWLIEDIITKKGVIQEVSDFEHLKPDVLFILAKRMRNLLVDERYILQNADTLSSNLFAEENALFTDFCFNHYVLGEYCKSAEFSLACHLFFL